jgi:hypothetical protein
MSPLLQLLRHVCDAASLANPRGRIFDMDKDPGAVALGKKRAQNLRKKLGSKKALTEHMRKVRAGEKLS